MKLIKKLLGIAAIIAIVAIIGFLAACSTGDDGTITPKPDDGTTKPNPDDGKTSSGDKTPISVAEISITAPVNGGIPATSVEGEEDERFTAGPVTWDPNDNPFKPNTEYTATVTLTAKSGLTFTGLNANNAKINVSVASVLSNTGATVTLSHKFPATSTKIVTSIAIKSTPNKMSYTHGEKLDLTGMAVTLTYNDGASEDVAAVNFAAKGITAIPAEGTHLVHTTHDDKPITIEHGSLTPLTTGKLTVAVVDVNVLTIEPNPIPAATYTGSDIEPSITVKHPVVDSTRTLEKGVDYTVSYSNNTDAGTAKITITGKGDYTGSKDIPFTINKASGAAVSAPSLNKLWNTNIDINAVTAPTNGQSVEYGISKTNDAATVSQWQDGTSLSGAWGYVYYIFARSKANDNYFAGEASVLTVTNPYEESLGTSGGYHLAEWLNLQPVNTPATAYIIQLRLGNAFTVIASELKKSDRYAIVNVITTTNNTIANGALRDCPTLVSITIPNTVTSIGQMAFGNCTALTSITIPDGVTSIGTYAFSNCTGLTTINVDAGNSAYSSQDGVLYNKAKTTLVAYPAGKTGSTFTIPGSVTSIVDSAFDSCTSLTSITIPNSVNSITGNPVPRCTSLTAINVDSGNSVYSSQDGILYNKDKTTLIKYPAGKTNTTFTMPNSVTSIGDSAFDSCATLTSITIPDSVISIESNAFRQTSLTSVTIGSGVTSIGNNVFYACTNLTSIIFATGSNIPDANFGTGFSPEGSTGAGGNTLKTAYNAASPKAGTYTRVANGSTWSKQP
jgi:hypothetical protein